MTIRIMSTCDTCQKTFPTTTRRRNSCPSCTNRRHATNQAAAGETCTGCGRPPGKSSPLRGTKKYGKNYCHTCLRRKEKGLPLGLDYIQVQENPAETRKKPEPIPPEITEANRRALAYWLARNYRTKERQAA